jgi:hypothetical protein
MQRVLQDSDIFILRTGSNTTVSIINTRFLSVCQLLLNDSITRDVSTTNLSIFNYFIKKIGIRSKKEFHD